MSVNNQKKVFVTGCFDILHSGHIAFLKEASQFGDLYVGLGSDKTVYDLKGRKTINSEDERLYMLEALSCVHSVNINKGSGILDFLEDMTALNPDVFIVNEDGHTPEKEKICSDLKIEYKVLKRIPHANLPVRSTTSLRKETPIPYRIDLAGTWIDQPYVQSIIRAGQSPPQLNQQLSSMNVQEWPPLPEKRRLSCGITTCQWKIPKSWRRYFSGMITIRVPRM
jgi:cytidyltransferase-like protein